MASFKPALDSIAGRLQDVCASASEILQEAMEQEVQRRVSEHEMTLQQREQSVAEKKQALEKREQLIVQMQRSLDQREKALDQLKQDLAEREQALLHREHDLEQQFASSSGKVEVEASVLSTVSTVGQEMPSKPDAAKVSGPASAAVKWPTRPAWDTGGTEDQRNEEEESYASLYARSKKPDAQCTLVEEDRLGKVQSVVREAQVSAGELRDQFSQPWRSDLKVDREDPSVLVSQREENAQDLVRKFSSSQKSDPNIEREDASLVVGQASSSAGQLRGQFEPQARTEVSRQAAAEPPKVQIRTTLFGQQAQEDGSARQARKKSLQELLQEDQEKAGQI